MTGLPFRRHRPPRGQARLALTGDFPGTDRDITEALGQRDDWDGTTWEDATGAVRTYQLPAAIPVPPPPPPPGPDRIGQLWQAISLLQFRAGLDPGQDPETIARATRVLRAGPDAPLIERVWGQDPDDPEQAADFSDVNRSLSQWAQAIWGGGKHRTGTR